MAICSIGECGSEDRVRLCPVCEIMVCFYHWHDTKKHVYAHRYTEANSWARIGYCGRCENLFPHEALTHNPYSLKVYASYCADCMVKELASYERTCKQCDAAFIASCQDEINELCGACRIKDMHREAKLVQRQLNRARAVNLPATLTLEEWTATLAYFGGLCPYCEMGAYTEMDHYLPMSQGGGTTQENCIPVCRDCNMSKGARPFRSERVEEFITSIKKEANNGQ